MSSLTRKFFGGGGSSSSELRPSQTKPPQVPTVKGPKLENISSRKPPLNGTTVPIGPKEILSVKNLVSDLKSASPVSSQYNSAAGTGSAVENELPANLPAVTGKPYPRMSADGNVKVHPHRLTMHAKLSNNAFSAQAHANHGRDALARDLSETAAIQRGSDTVKKMNAVKRISRNSIALFSFSGRSKKRTADANTEQKKITGEAHMFVKSGSTKNFNEPRIGKLDFEMPPTNAFLYKDGQNSRSNQKTQEALDQRQFSDSIETMQRRIDSQARENDDLKYSLQINKQSLQSMILESQRTAAKEQSLIETINIISQDNSVLKEQVETIRQKLVGKQLLMTDQEVQTKVKLADQETQTKIPEVKDSQTDQADLLPKCLDSEAQTESRKLTFEPNVIGSFEITKDVFNSSARSSQEQKCCQCGGRKTNSRGNRNEESKQRMAQQANASGNQIFAKGSPIHSPLEVSPQRSPIVAQPLPPKRDSRLDQIQQTKMRILQTEVSVLKQLLSRLLDDITIQLPMDMRSEIQTVVDMPEVVSPGRNFMQAGSEQPIPVEKQFRTNLNSTGAADMASNHDFLAQIPLSPKQDSDGDLSDLSSTFWSAAISIKLDFESTHDRIKHLIPELDLDNLPPDSDDEQQPNQQNSVNVESQDIFYEEDLGGNTMSMAHVNTFHQNIAQNNSSFAHDSSALLYNQQRANNSSSLLDASRFNQSGFGGAGGQNESRVMDLFAQVDALQADERDHDLDELAAFDMNMRASRLQGDIILEEHQRDSRVFLESFERDPDLLDDNDMQELQMAQSILQECGLDSSGKKFDPNPGHQASPTASELNRSSFHHKDQILNRLSDLQGNTFTQERDLEDLSDPLTADDHNQQQQNHQMEDNEAEIVFERASSPFKLSKYKDQSD